MTTTLREQVARVLVDYDSGDPDAMWSQPDYLEVADAAVGVVLAAVTEQIKASDWTDGVQTAAAAGFHSACEELLAVVARLGEDAT